MLDNVFVGINVCFYLLYFLIEKLTASDRCLLVIGWTPFVLHDRFTVVPFEWNGDVDVHANSGKKNQNEVADVV